MMSLAGMRTIRELGRAREEIAQYKRNAAEQARLSEAAESIVARLETDLRKERQVSSQSMQKIRELQAQLTDGEKLNDLFRKTTRYSILEAELFKVGGEYARSLIRKKSPELDTLYVQEALVHFVNSMTEAAEAEAARAGGSGNQVFEEETIDVDVDAEG